MPSSKLREATSGSARSTAASRRSHNVFTEDPIVIGPRTSRSKRKLVEVNTSDEEDLEDQEEDEVDDEDAPGEDDDDDDDADADADADGDVDMDDAPPQPPVSKRHAKGPVAASSSRKPAKSVEAKEMELEEEDDEDEEELSEPDTDADGEPDDQDEGVTINADGGEELEDEEEDLDESDDGTPTAADYSKLTKRQRGSLGNDFLQLPMEPQIKKHLTAEERQMRRAEMARRRKNLSEKRNEEEKMDTINRLLRKQAPKRRGRIPAAEAAENAAADQEAAAETESVDPTMVRWVSGREGSRIGVPEEWIGTPAGRIFGGTRKMVEEV